MQVDGCQQGLGSCVIEELTVQLHSRAYFIRTPLLPAVGWVDDREWQTKRRGQVEGPFTGPEMRAFLEDETFLDSEVLVRQQWLGCISVLAGRRAACACTTCHW